MCASKGSRPLIPRRSHVPRRSPPSVGVFLCHSVFAMQPHRGRGHCWQSAWTHANDRPRAAAGPRGRSTEARGTKQASSGLTNAECGVVVPRYTNGQSLHGRPSANHLWLSCRRLSLLRAAPPGAVPRRHRRPSASSRWPGVFPCLRLKSRTPHARPIASGRR